MKKLSFLIILCLHLIPLQAQSWQELQNECEQYIDAGQFDAALKQAEKMYSYADRKYDKLSEEYIYSLRTIAKIYNLSRNSKKAVEYYHEAYSLILARIKKNVPGMGMSLDYTKDYFSYVTDPVANAQFYEKACDRMMKVDTVDYTVLTDITKYYTDAIAQTYGTASPEQKDLSPEEGSIDDELYLAYYDSVIKAGMQYGKYEQALKNIALIRKFREDKQDTESIEYASHFFNSGYMLYLKQRYDQSYEEYQKGFELWEKGQFAINELYGTSIYFYGALYMIKQDWSSVLELFEAHVDEIEKALGKDFIFYESVLSSLASAYKVKGEYDKAEEFYERYKEVILAKDSKDENKLLGYYVSVAPLFDKLGKKEKAKDAYVKANYMYLSLLNSLTSNITLSTESRIAQSFVWFNYSLNSFYSFCLANYSKFPYLTGDIYNDEIVKKGIVMRTIKELVALIVNSDNEELKAVFDEWVFYRERYAKLKVLPISERKESLAEIESKVRLLEQQISSGIQEERKSKDKATIGWKDIQQKLQTDEAALEFIHFHAQDISGEKWSDSIMYCALLIRPDYTYPKLIPLFTERDFRTFLNRNKGKNAFDQVRRLYTRYKNKYRSYFKGDSLYNFVWKPIEKHLSGVNKIYYSPSGLLHKISFAAIPVEDDLLLIDKYSLQHMSSTSMLTRDHADIKVDEKYKALLYGGILYDSEPDEWSESGKQFREDHSDYFIRDRSFQWTDSLRSNISWSYLQGTLNEVQKIDSLLTKYHVSTTKLTRSNALEESFKQKGQEMPEIIHIATHGFFFPEKKVKSKSPLNAPTFNYNETMNVDNSLMRSGLLFAGANNVWKGGFPPEGMEDGVLTAYEVSKLNLRNTKLVVLSACETGLGEIKGSEGVYGLQRAFKLAGAEYVIMSLWQIPDQQTVELMTLFYKNWLEGNDIREAFYAAQKEMSIKYEPFYWAAFVLVE